MRNAIVFAIPVFFLLIAFEWWVMKRKQRELYRLNDTINDLSCGICQQILRAFIKAFLLGAYIYLYTHYRAYSPSVRAIWVWVFAFFAVDFCYYWFHRAGHRVNAIWAAHVVHHQSEEYNLAVALRQGAFQPFFTILFYLPLALLGVPPLVFAVTVSLNTLYQFWIHTRLIGKLGWLEWFLNTPSHHRVHHGKNPAYLDKNYAGILIIWDRMFGTFQEEQEEPVYGVTERLNSWNPLWANFHTWAHLAQKVSRHGRWYDWLLVWWMPPEWAPANAPPAPPHPELDPTTYEKYNPDISLSLKIYLVIQFLLALGATLYMLQYQGQLGNRPLAFLAGFACLSLFNIGGLFDRMSWAYWLELGRLSALLLGAGIILIQPTLAANLLLSSPVSTYVAIATCVLSVAMILWLLQLRGRCWPEEPLTHV